FLPTTGHPDCNTFGFGPRKERTRSSPFFNLSPRSQDSESEDEFDSSAVADICCRKPMPIRNGIRGPRSMSRTRCVVLYLLRLIHRTQ
ncbi:unnamed protein product, partial [Amoebophrya sp. A25]